MREEEIEFENKNSKELCSLLRRFYAEARTKAGKPYSRTAMQSIRAALQRHIISPPYNRTISIVSDAEFKPANLVFNGRLKQNRAAGHDTTKHKDAIEPGDIIKMYSSGTLSNKTPKALQYKVFFEISLHFARRAKEGLRELRKDSFEIKSDHTGTRFATIGYNEKSKKDHGEKKEFTEKEQRLYEQPDDPRCPVKSLELYLDKLHPDSNDFFQQARSGSSDEIWYNGRPIGTNTLAKFMPNISREASLSRMYTNHCIRATSITVLSANGVDATDIIGVTGHKTIQSLLPYQRKVGDEKRRGMSNILSNYGKPEVLSKPATATAADIGGQTAEAIATPTENATANLQLKMSNQSQASYAQNLLKGVMEGNHFQAQQMYFTVSVNK